MEFTYLLIFITKIHQFYLSLGCFTTTTTTAPTTTSPCQSCSLATITLTTGNQNQGTTTPTTTGIQRDANNCNTLTVTCTAQAGGQVFMQFNVNQGGPLNPIGTVVSATFTCVNGQWVFAPGMGLPSRVVTEVNCISVAG